MTNLQLPRTQEEQEAPSMLMAIASRESSLVSKNFVYNAEIMGEEVTLLRDYASARHRDVLSENQRKILEMPGLPGGGMPLFADYVDLMMQMLQSRLNVDTIDPVVENQADYERAQEWINNLLANNRFDSLQNKIHEAALRDGESYVMCNWNPQRGHAKFYRNLAYDGYIGVIPVIDLELLEMTAAIKILNGKYRVYKRVLQPDMITEQISYYEVELTYSEETGFAAAKSSTPISFPPGVLPIVRFHYREDPLTHRGVSPILRAIPLQDALNHSLGATLVSAIFGAYRTLFAKNWKPEIDRIEPGMIHHAIQSDEEHDVDLKAVGEGSLTPYLDQNAHIIGLMGDVLQLLFPSVSGSSPSGESLKERVAGLVSQIQKMEIELGNAWEDLMRLAWHVESTHAPASQKPPPIKRFKTIWKSSEVRDDNAIVNRLVQVFSVIPSARLFLEQARDVLELDDDAIANLLDEIESAEQQRLSHLGMLREAGDFAEDPSGIPNEPELDEEDDADEDDSLPS